MGSLQELHDFAVRLARDTGKLVLDGLPEVRVKDKKDRRDLVTNIDIRAEKFLVSQISKRYPDHCIHSEEMDDIVHESCYTWILDPIDGTKHFVNNIPLFAVSIAIEENGEPIVGVVFDPNTDRLYHAYKGGGAFLNSERITVSDTSSVDEAMLYLDITQLHELASESQNIALARMRALLIGVYRVRAFGLGSLGLCYVAQGGLDAYFDLTGKTKRVDLAAGKVIVQEAGGNFSFVDENLLLATNGVLDEDLLKLLNT